MLRDILTFPAGNSAKWNLPRMPKKSHVSDPPCEAGKSDSFGLPPRLSIPDREPTTQDGEDWPLPACARRASCLPGNPNFANPPRSQLDSMAQKISMADQSSRSSAADKSVGNAMSTSNKSNALLSPCLMIRLLVFVRLVSQPRVHRRLLRTRKCLALMRRRLKLRRLYLILD